jgi:REP element-mobilizing transposase RayT
MPRKPLIRSTEYPYHVTARCNNKEHFPIPIYDVWAIVSAEINVIVEKFGCEIHAFVLMPNHFHLLITTPAEGLGVVMQAFMLSVTKKINVSSGRTGRVFGGRYHGSLIDNEHYFDCALKYVYRNPVKAKLSNSVETYPFSTIQDLLKDSFFEFPLKPPSGHQSLIPEKNVSAFLGWLNLPFPNEQDLAIKGAFKKTRFVPNKSGWKQVKAKIVDQGH